MERTTNYVMTIDPESVTDNEKLEVVKATVRALNESLKYSTDKRYRVTLKGRKPRMKQWLSIWDRSAVNGRRMAERSYYQGGNIVGGIQNATRIDVYIHQRT